MTNKEFVALEGDKILKSEVYEEVKVILPVVERMAGMTPEQVESIMLPEGSHLERVNDDRFILDFKHLGIDLDIENGVIVQPNAFSVYTQDPEGDLSVFFAMINPYNLNMYN